MCVCVCTCMFGDNVYFVCCVKWILSVSDAYTCTCDSYVSQYDVYVQCTCKYDSALR